MPRPVQKRLKHRIPVKLRHHWKVPASCGVFFAVLIGLVGTSRVAPIVTSDQRAEANVVTQDIAGTVDLFDSGTAHEVTLTYTEDDYQRMLDQYWKDGEKEYVEADLVIDGVRVPSVGIRLKGNSTLSSLTRDGERAPNGLGGRRRDGAAEGGGMPNFGGGGGPAGGAPAGGAQAGGAQAGGAQAGGAPAGGGRGMGMSALKAEEPENLPWLVSFDEYVDGRRYQGHSEIAVRPAGMGGATNINEAVALSLVARSGEPSQGYAYSSFTINHRPTVSRLLVEHPDATYADSLDGDGVLYKSLAGGQFADQGDDPTDYQDDFKQINLKGSQDLQPLIDLIQWVATSSDAEFAEGVDERVDVHSFARYLALQNLLLNFDDMSGPGKNYYLYYDLDTKRFRVITWDLNLSMSGNAAQGPHESGGFGAFGGGRGQQTRQGQQGQGQQGEGTQPPEGFEPPAGFQPPEGFERPADGQLPGGGRGMMMGNKLKDRFLANADLKTVYEDEYRALYQKLYASGAATTALNQAVSAVKAAGGDGPTVDKEAATLRTLIDNRTKSLATNEVITRK